MDAHSLLVGVLLGLVFGWVPFLIVFYYLLSGEVDRLFQKVEFRIRLSENGITEDFKRRMGHG